MFLSKPLEISCLRSHILILSGSSFDLAFPREAGHPGSPRPPMLHNPQMIIIRTSYGEIVLQYVKPACG